MYFFTIIGITYILMLRGISTSGHESITKPLTSLSNIVTTWIGDETATTTTTNATDITTAGVINVELNDTSTSFSGTQNTAPTTTQSLNSTGTFIITSNTTMSPTSTTTNYPTTLLSTTSTNMPTTSVYEASISTNQTLTTTESATVKPQEPPTDRAFSTYNNPTTTPLPKVTTIASPTIGYVKIPEKKTSGKVVTASTTTVPPTPTTIIHPTTSPSTISTNMPTTAAHEASIRTNQTPTTTESATVKPQEATTDRAVTPYNNPTTTPHPKVVTIASPTTTTGYDTELEKKTSSKVETTLPAEAAPAANRMKSADIVSIVIPVLCVLLSIAAVATSVILLIAKLAGRRSHFLVRKDEEEALQSRERYQVLSADFHHALSQCREIPLSLVNRSQDVKQ